MGRPRKDRRPDLFLVLDFGGSLTKGIYLDKASDCERLLCMEPEVISVTQSGIENYEATKLGSPESADSAWVGLNGTDYYAVGYLARKHFNGNAGLSQFKYERALFKTLAAVWVAAARLELKNKFSLALGVLLPAGEFENASRLHEMIANKLKDFETPTGNFNVSLIYWDCKPEGAGIYLRHSAKEGDALKRKTVAVVMIGYRNASVLVSERGVVGKRVTSNLGFVRLVEAVEKRISTVASTCSLTSAIARAGEKVEKDCLRPLIASSLPCDREKDLDNLVAAVKDSREQYALSLQSWFKEVLPKALDEVILCGGTAEYMQSELEDYFANTCVVWNAGIELPESLHDPEVGNRILDAYGMYRYCLLKVGKQVASATSDSKEVTVRG
jgi:hypothetical protein